MGGEGALSLIHIYDIDAAALGGREHLIQVTLGVVVEGTPGAEALHELPASVVAGRAVHDGPDAMRKLHREGCLLYTSRCV